MPVTVVVGGQYGSEGKGKVAQFFVQKDSAAAAIRVGGPNSGHTGIDTGGHRTILRQLPTAALLPDVLCVLAPGSYIEPDLLLREIAQTRLEPRRLLIDRNAVIVLPDDREVEVTSDLRQRLGSTASGTGAAVSRRVNRVEGTLLARDVPELRGYIGDTVVEVRRLLDSDKRVVVEGSQGLGLSVLHSPYYPFATSRDTSAAGAISEAGLSPRDVDEVVLVIRAFPIRVAGNSGPLDHETTWSAIAAAAGFAGDLAEFTSVTGKLRRVAEFDPEIVRRAIAINQPSKIVLNHVDYVDAQCGERGDFTSRARAFVARVSRDIAFPISYVGFGPQPSFVELTAPYAVVASS